jgi:hypothetical protein
VHDMMRTTQAIPRGLALLLACGLVGACAATPGASVKSGAQATAVTTPAVATDSPLSFAPSAPSSALDAYRAARDAICVARAAATPPPNSELWDADKLYDPNMSAADRAKSLEVGRWIAAQWEATAGQLDALTPPSEIAKEHDETVIEYRDNIALLRHEIDLLGQGKYSDARVVDDSLPDPSKMSAFETKYGLQSC